MNTIHVSIPWKQDIHAHVYQFLGNMQAKVYIYCVLSAMKRLNKFSFAHAHAVCSCMAIDCMVISTYYSRGGMAQFVVAAI